MTAADDDRILSESGNGDGREEPVFVLPSAGATTTQGLGGNAGSVTASPVLPVPILSSDEDHATLDNLASRVEQMLADDGRFSSLVNSLTIVDNGSGHITLSGPSPDASLRASLLATLRAVPGVTQVTDAMTA